MTTWLLNIALALLFSIYFSGFVLSKILLIAFKKNLFDEMNDRKIHKSLVPRLGGIAFKPVVCFTMVFIVGYNLSAGNDSVISSFARDAESLAYVFCASMVIYVVGICDDLIGIHYQAKFIAQILCGILLVSGNLYIDDFYGLFGVHALSPVIAYPLTILLVVFIINAINLIDGIDGLASGLSTLALAYFGCTFFYIEEYVPALLSFSVLGVLIPFFYYNVFGTSGKKNKIFMGDTGSMTIGMVLCALSLKLLLTAPEYQGPVPNPLILAYAPLIIPCFDVIRVYIGRISRGSNPFLPDKSHIHHKMMEMGMKQNRAMIILLLSSIILTLGNILISCYVNISVLVLADAVLWIIMNSWMNWKIKKVGKIPCTLTK